MSKRKDNSGRANNKVDIDARSNKGPKIIIKGAGTVYVGVDSKDPPKKPPSASPEPNDNLTSKQYLAAGKQYQKSGDYEIAIDNYVKSIAIESEQFSAHYHKAECLENLAYESETRSSRLEDNTIVNRSRAFVALSAYEHSLKHFEDENIPKWNKFWNHFHVAELSQKLASEEDNLERKIEQLNKAKDHYKLTNDFVSKSKEIRHQTFWRSYNLGEVRADLRKIHSERARAYKKSDKKNMKAKAKKEWNNAGHNRNEAIKCFLDAEKNLKYVQSGMCEEMEFWTYYNTADLSVFIDPPYEKRHIEKSKVDDINEIKENSDRLAKHVNQRSIAITYFLKARKLVSHSKGKIPVTYIDKQMMVHLGNIESSFRLFREAVQKKYSINYNKKESK